MGPCSSSDGAIEATENWGAPSEDLALDGARARGGTLGDVDIDAANDARPDDDGEFFEFEADEVREGEQFLSVRPWKAAAAVEPESHPEEDRSPPDVTYELEHVYGYRCQDTKQNVYYNPDGNIVYFTACLGVILDKNENKQTYFGGGEVTDESKQTASSKLHHTNDIMSIGVNTSDRSKAVTGQQGKSPAVFVWDTITGEKIFRTNLNRTAREVSAIAINPDGTHIATADRSNDHIVSVYDIGSGKALYSEKGGPDQIHGLAFAQDGSRQLWSAGVKHLQYYKYNEGKKNKGLFGSNARTSFACITADDSGNSYSGGTNSQVYKWGGNKCVGTYSKHEKGFIGAVLWQDGKVYSGGKDGRVVIVDAKSFE